MIERLNRAQGAMNGPCGGSGDLATGWRFRGRLGPAFPRACRETVVVAILGRPSRVDTGPAHRTLYYEEAVEGQGAPPGERQDRRARPGGADPTAYDRPGKLGPDRSSSSAGRGAWSKPDEPRELDRQPSADESGEAPPHGVAAIGVHDEQVASGLELPPPASVGLQRPPCSSCTERGRRCTCAGVMVSVGRTPARVTRVSASGLESQSNERRGFQGEPGAELHSPRVAEPGAIASEEAPRVEGQGAADLAVGGRAAARWSARRSGSYPRGWSGRKPGSPLRGTRSCG